MAGTRSWLYQLARWLGNWSALKSGDPKKITRRIGRRAAGRATGRALWRLFKQESGAECGGVGHAAADSGCDHDPWGVGPGLSPDLQVPDGVRHGQALAPLRSYRRVTIEV